MTTPFAPSGPEQPHNFQVEQALLGALLVKNSVYDNVSDVTRTEHFADPLHGRIWDTAARMIGENSVVDYRTLKTFFATDETLIKAGRPNYLAELAAAAISTMDARDYALQLRDLWKRRRIMEIAQGYAIDAASPSIDMPADDLLAAMETDLLAIHDDAQQTAAVSPLRTVAHRALARIESIYKGEPQPGLRTGYRAIDHILRGMDGGDLIILAGRPSMGKSSLAWGIAQNNAARFAKERQSAEPEKIVVFFSQEMRDEHLALISMGQEALVSPTRAEGGTLNAADMDRLLDAVRIIEDLAIEIDDRPQITTAMMRTSLRRLRRRHQIGMVIVDHLQLMRLAKPRRDENRVLEIGQLTADLKAIAKDFDCPVMALSQLSRRVEEREDKRPQLADLRESGSIEQDADVVMFVYREEYYLKRSEPVGTDGKAQQRRDEWNARMREIRGLAQVIVSKQRRGPVDTAKLGFQEEYQRFHDV